MKMTLADFEAHQRKHGFAGPVAKPALIVASPKRLDFFMEFEPPTVTAQHKGAQIIIPKTWPQQPLPKPFIHWFTKKEIEQAEKLLAAQLAPFRPAAPFQGPLKLVAEWTFPWRTSEPKKNRAAGWMFKDTAPDCGNSNKALEDVMQREGFFINDSQLAFVTMIKFWGDRPGIKITLEALQNP